MKIKEQKNLITSLTKSLTLIISKKEIIEFISQITNDSDGVMEIINDEDKKLSPSIFNYECTILNMTEIKDSPLQKTEKQIEKKRVQKKQKNNEVVQNWSQEDDRIFFEKHPIIKNKWRILSEIMQKTETQVKNFYHLNLRKTTNILVTLSFLQKDRKFDIRLKKQPFYDQEQILNDQNTNDMVQQQEKKAQNEDIFVELQNERSLYFLNVIKKILEKQEYEKSQEKMIQKMIDLLSAAGYTIDRLNQVIQMISDGEIEKKFKLKHQINHYKIRENIGISNQEQLHEGTQNFIQNMVLNTTRINSNQINISKSDAMIKDQYMIIDVPQSTEMVDLKLKELFDSFME